MRLAKLLSQCHVSQGRVRPGGILPTSNVRVGPIRPLSSSSKHGDEEHPPEPKELMDYLDSLTNYEKLGTPKGGGTDSDEGLDLGRMRRLLDRLGNPHSKFKAVHIAGTKGKGSTAAFVASVLRAAGYNVGCYTSPHLLSMRERMTLGKSGDLVSAEALNSLFYSIKHKLDEAIQNEQGCLTHFEVLTAMAYSLFSDEKVDIAVIEAGLGGARDATNVISSSGLAASVITTIGEEHLLALGGSLKNIARAKAGIIKQGRPVILGGPFLPHIEHILRDKAAKMSSPVISAYDAGIGSTVRGIEVLHGRPYQLSDLKIQFESDSHSFLELSNLKLRMLGSHQLHNASTAACTTLCLRNQGWRISDDSIRAGLETTYLLGRSQYLSVKEAEELGLPRSRVLLDGAHTKESAKALVETIRMAFPEAQVALVVAMASDKDHSAFAREFLSGMRQIAAVFLTEVNIAGGKSRTTSASVLRDHWVQASKEVGINVFRAELDGSQGLPLDQLVGLARKNQGTLLISESSLQNCMVLANRTLEQSAGKQPRLIVVTGSLHVVSSVLASHRNT